MTFLLGTISFSFFFLELQFRFVPQRRKLIVLKFTQHVKHLPYPFIVIDPGYLDCGTTAWNSGVSGQAVQPVPLASLKLSMAVYGQKLDGRPSR